VWLCAGAVRADARAHATRMHTPGVCQPENKQVHTPLIARTRTCVVQDDVRVAVEQVHDLQHHTHAALPQPNLMHKDACVASSVSQGLGRGHAHVRSLVVWCARAAREHMAVHDCGASPRHTCITPSRTHRRPANAPRATCHSKPRVPRTPTHPPTPPPPTHLHVAGDAWAEVKQAADQLAHELQLLGHALCNARQESQHLNLRGGARV
jgi:hypothetical protein